MMAAARPRSLKKLVRHVMAKYGARHLFNPVFGGHGSVLMFHNVSLKHDAANRLVANIGLEVTPDFLRRLTRRLKARGYEFVSLDQVAERLKSGQRSSKRFVCVTFDDGYEANFSLAYPILKEENVPFAIYVTTGFIDRTVVPWWYGVEELLLKHDDLELTMDGTKVRFRTENGPAKEEAFGRIRSWVLSSNQDAIQPWIIRELEQRGIDPHKYCRELAMTWDQVATLARDPLCTIAGHTHTHVALKLLDDKRLAEEVDGSSRQLAERIGKPVRHFAYPYGDHTALDERVLAATRDFGFATSTTTFSGNIHAEHSGRLHHLPRIAVAGDEEDFDVLALAMSGANSVLLGGARRVV